MKYCFGIDIGGTTVKMGLFQEDGELLDKWEIKTRTENQGEAILPDIAQAVKAKMAEKKLVKEQIIGLGMGLPAPVTEDGIVQNTANLGWGYKEVTRELEELLDGMKVIPGNDANVAALGEMWKGGGNSEQLHSSNANPCQVTAFIECSNTAGAYNPIFYISKVCLCTTNCHLYHKDPCPERGLNHSKVVIRKQ